MSSGNHQDCSSAEILPDSVFPGSQFLDWGAPCQGGCSRCPRRMSAWVHKVHCPRNKSHCPRCSCSECRAQWRLWRRNGALSRAEDGQSVSWRRRRMTPPLAPPWQPSSGRESSEVLDLILTFPSSGFLLVFLESFLVRRHT